MAPIKKLFTREFLALNGVIFLVFCNVAVFFQFQNYLQEDLRFPAHSLGFLIGIFAFTALVVRPLISPFVHSDNARKYLFLSTIGVIIALLLYYPARGFWSMTLVRVFHGGIYVVLATAALTKMMDSIPEGQSGQAFGMITVITLLPYAVMPPLLDPLSRLFGGFLPVLYLTALLMVLVFPLLALIKTGHHEKGTSPKPSLARAEIIENLKDRQIFSLLLISLLVYTAFAPVFFFLKGYAQQVGLANPGLFFSLSTFMEIAVRLFAGTLLDRGSKVRSLAISLIVLTGAYIFLAHTADPILFYGLGLAFGLCWGVAMPLMNGLIFDCSGPRFRALNTNLGMVMFQGGFFLGPLLGGWIIGDGAFQMLYYVCSLMILGALLLLPLVRKRKDKETLDPYFQTEIGEPMPPIPNDYVVEPGQSYEFDLFRPEDAEGVVHLFKTVYGEGYPIRTFIDPQRLIEENKAGRTLSSVARTPKGDIVGHCALFCSAPYRKLYESGAGLVHPNYRGGAGIFSGLGLHGEKIAPRFGIETLFGEPVCNHVFAQRAVAGQGWVTHALEVDLMPGEAYDKEQSALGRVSTLTGFKTLQPKPHQVFLPRIYEEQMNFLYSGLDDTREIKIADDAPLPETSTELNIEVFDFAQVARIAVNRGGADLIPQLIEEEKKLTARQVVVIQVWLNLSSPWINTAVSRLQSIDYFLGGLLPRWFDSDGMLMQKLFIRPNWEGIQLYFDRAKRLLEWIRLDWERTLR